MLIYPDGNSLSNSNNQTTQLFENLVTGIYTVAVSDSSGCSYIDEKTIYAAESIKYNRELGQKNKSTKSD